MTGDQEKEKLARIERELAADDPRLARLLSAPPRWHRARRVRRVILLALLVALALAALGIALASAV